MQCGISRLWNNRRHAVQRSMWQPEHEMEKVLFAADELTGSDLGSSINASVQEHKGYGTEIPQEKVQE